MLCFPALSLAEAQSLNWDKKINRGNPQLVRTAQKYIGVREKGKNRGEQIEKWQRQFGGRPGEPYCAYFVAAMLEESNSQVPKIRSGLAQRYRNAQSIKANQVAKGYVKVREGWLLIWAKIENGRNTGKGHIGICERQIDRHNFQTIEANTRSGNKGKQADGDGVYRRYRKIGKMGKYKLVFITPSF